MFFYRDNFVYAYIFTNKQNFSDQKGGAHIGAPLRTIVVGDFKTSAKLLDTYLSPRAPSLIFLYS